MNGAHRVTCFIPHLYFTQLLLLPPETPLASGLAQRLIASGEGSGEASVSTEIVIS